jgi:hypothetical protein
VTPAHELRTAAQTLMDLADVAQEDLDRNDYWACYDKATAWRDGLVNGFGGAPSDLAAVFSPATAHLIAAWLRGAAGDAEQIGADPAALAAARAINAA